MKGIQHMGVTVNKVFNDKIFISKDKSQMSGIILTNTTPVYRVEMISDNLTDYINVDLQPGDKIIIHNRSEQFAYTFEGKEYFFVRAGDVLCKIEDEEGDS